VSSTEAALQVETETGYADVNGARLYYEMAGEGEPIVMIHGLGWDNRDWDYQFAEFARQYQVVRYDMRGFGKSDRPTDQPYSHADDLKALLESLGIESAHVFGHSFGGEIALNFAAAYPEATRSLVLIEPDIQGAQGLPALTPEEEASFAAAFAALEEGDRTGAGLAIVDLHPLVAIAKDVPGARELVLEAFTDYDWWQFLNKDPVVQPTAATAERIGEITAPTFLAVGDKTTEFQAIEVDRLATQMPDATKVLYENSDHFPHLLYPEKFNADVLDFLKEAVPTGAAAADTSAATPTLDPALTAEIDEYVAAAVEEDAVPGLAVGVVKDGELVYGQGFGAQNLETGEAVTPETLFLGAELSFVPTALAALKLADEGKLDLDAPITDYLPTFSMKNGDATKITARQLLSHFSGIPDSGDQMAVWSDLTPSVDEASIQEWLATFARRELSFDPGTSWEYTDMGFAVLGAVISAASGMPYEEYVNENVFAPLGMENTTLMLDEADPALLAAPHVAGTSNERVVSENYPWHRPFAGANNLITNVDDLAKLAAALTQGGRVGDAQVISPEAMDGMWASQVDSPFADFLFGVETPSGLMQEYGAGWFIGDINGEPVVDAFGNEAGFTNLLVIAPEAGVAVMVLGNGSVLESYYAANIATDVTAKVLEGSGE
jgi:CubicO group peptidase (beta-lactamase class C family)